MLLKDKSFIIKRRDKFLLDSQTTSNYWKQRIRINMLKLPVIILLVFAMPLPAQVETLFGEGETTHGIFGSPVIKFTNINGQFGLLVGGRGGWILDHQLSIGGGGYGLVNKVKGDIVMSETTSLLNFGYGGLELEYISNYKKLVHLTYYLLIGAGIVDHRYWWTENDRQADAFFIVEPAVGIEMNVKKYFSIALSTSYRLISGVQKGNLSNNDFNKLSLNMTLKFGEL